MNWDFTFKVIGSIGAVLGAWALVRSYWLTRSKLVLRQDSTKLFDGSDASLKVTLLVSNLSSQGNSVVQWKAWLKGSNGEWKEQKVQHGHQSGADNKVDYEFNVIPLNVISQATVPTIMFLFHIKKTEYAEPLELKVQAKDMYGRKHSCAGKVVPSRT